MTILGGLNEFVVKFFGPTGSKETRKLFFLNNIKIVIVYNKLVFFVVGRITFSIVKPTLFILHLKQIHDTQSFLET